ncbi:MAG: hypothetical protein EXR50_08560, partial [Dehalococcoidia bacterium]|nr:hypothetical protein [Dehalococcoidia bacterium]
HIVEGQTGFLVPPGDAKALADKLKFVLDNPAVAREVAERGRDYVHENLTWTKVMLRVRNEVYMPLAEKRADRRKVAIA